MFQKRPLIQRQTTPAPSGTGTVITFPPTHLHKHTHTHTYRERERERARARVRERERARERERERELESEWLSVWEKESERERAHAREREHGSKTKHDRVQRLSSLCSQVPRPCANWSTLHVCHMRRRIHACYMKRRIHKWAVHQHIIVNNIIITIAICLYYCLWSGWHCSRAPAPRHLGFFKETKKTQCPLKKKNSVPFEILPHQATIGHTKSVHCPRTQCLAHELSALWNVTIQSPL